MLRTTRTNNSASFDLLLGRELRILYPNPFEAQYLEGRKWKHGAQANIKKNKRISELLPGQLVSWSDLLRYFFWHQIRIMEVCRNLRLTFSRFVDNQPDSVFTLHFPSFPNCQ